MQWKYEVDIRKDLNNDDFSLEEKATKLTAILKSVPFGVAHPYLTLGLKILQEAGKLDDVELFDDGLVYIYDWADAEKIWLGI